MNTNQLSKSSKLVTIPTVVDKIIRLVTRAEFKRRQAPPGLKITDRAFGTGWRMPIASRSVTVTTQQVRQSVNTK